SGRGPDPLRRLHLGGPRGAQTGRRPLMAPDRVAQAHERSGLTARQFGCRPGGRMLCSDNVDRPRTARRPRCHPRSCPPGRASPPHARTERFVDTVNLGILAHVDAGKTTLTERLLYAAGVIDEIGSVDHGSTQTDSLDLERQRGITIKSAVVSFIVGDTTINLIDTPGHPDFIAEVERVLSVLDGAVLVVSAVEGVQAQTRVLLRALRRLRTPTLIFVNKLDRGGADPGRALRTIAERLTPAVGAMGAAADPGTPAARSRPYGPDDPAFTARLAELLADHDDALLAAH